MNKTQKAELEMLRRMDDPWVDKVADSLVANENLWQAFVTMNGRLGPESGNSLLRLMYILDDFWLTDTLYIIPGESMNSDLETLVDSWEPGSCRWLSEKEVLEMDGVAGVPVLQVWWHN